MATIKAKVKDAASSAKAGIDKAKASAGEKVQKATTTDPRKKREAEENKEDRLLKVDSDEREEKGDHAAERSGRRTIITGT
ncbi:Protein LE25 [Hordeum vulgare]|uniref:Predicted protein n=1 Tax=Hordeum vulgare subsp. vulgare TaxID=112509 RepID=F2DUV9_HORVV|nr:protein LE25-like [Hordeum vulgare subsp. vulgare]KAE8782340.1 Protein LE25 [Hordeum vulgare]KAI4975363.1 hypothetical protein ZWY2020_048970 [Hordeum vulgare]KAI4975368.1 hypothetical protein ZWY2020_048975 [Hordeum vulgare]BAJ98880.1 predicted protein [Hordeum vulgare subsp. vulgare]BAK06812.1 predicted protein [Hordeum vulgare subsp. vulgare]